MPHCAAFHLGLHCLLKYQFRGFQYTKGPKHVRIQRGAQGVRTPLNNHKNKGFSSYTGPDPLKNRSYQASNQCWTIIRMPVKRHLMAFCWRADDRLLGSSLPPSTKVQSWTLPEKTFWIRACKRCFDRIFKKKSKLHSIVRLNSIQIKIRISAILIYQSKKVDKNQETTQSCATPDPGYQWASYKNTINITNKSQ